MNEAIPEPRSARGAATETAGPITRRALHDEVVARLRDLIVEGELAPGERVPERELCERFGISRTPLREALKVLAADGLVELQHHRGATVSQLNVAAIDDMFQVMEALESLAGELAGARASDAQIAAIRALHERMREHHARQELSDYFRLNQRIHESIVESAGNPTLSNLYRGLSVRIRRARYMANLSPARWDQAVAEHETILQALTARDGVRLGRLLREHLQHKVEVVKSVLLNKG
jgi:DNA-binding GntR family transcriptional regulator